MYISPFVSTISGATDAADFEVHTTPAQRRALDLIELIRM
jgi:hypothetical protein